MQTDAREPVSGRTTGVPVVVQLGARTCVWHLVGRLLAIVFVVVGLVGCRGARERLDGTWERVDNPGQTLTFDGERMIHAYPHGGRPISGPYAVVDDDSDAVVIEPTIEFADGRSLRADRQRIEFVDDDTFAMKNASNGSGGTYRRRAAG